MSSVLDSATRFLDGPGRLGKLIRSFDWSKTPLGPIEHWPQSLKTTISLMLNSRQPIWIGWGTDATFLYNDAYIDVLSLSKHPWALGRPAAEVWAEIWDICRPLADVVFKQGDATMADDVRLFMNRGDFLEETYFSFSYSPVRDESGNVAGLFCPNLDVTARHLNARRLRTVSDLAAKSLVEKTVEAACARAASTLAENSCDIPFSFLYLRDLAYPSARLVQSTPVDSIHFPGWDQIDLTADSDQTIWPLNHVFNTGEAQIISVKPGEGLPTGLAEQTVSHAILLPLVISGEEQPIGA
jgi:hypothetical protein